MDRLIATNSVPFSGADTAPATGTPQYATSGNPATAVPATLFPAYAFNAMQDEILAVILAAGLTPNRNTWNQLLTAIQTIIQSGATNVLTDTGAANAYVVTFSPALGAPVPGAPFWVKIAHTNNGASTLNATGTVYPIVGGAHAALQGNELFATGWALFDWNATLSSYVLLECTGAPVQIAASTQSGHAVNQSQVLGVGQTRQTVTRALSTTYTNSTGKPIVVFANGTTSAANGQLALSIVNGSVTSLVIGQNGSNLGSIGLTAIVMPGETYTMSAINTTLGTWQEIR